MFLINSDRKYCASTPSNAENLGRSESLKDKGDLSNSSEGDTADSEMVFSKKKIDYSLSYWLLMICLLLIIVGSTVFIFFTKGSGNKRPIYYISILLETLNQNWLQNIIILLLAPRCPGDLVYSECHSRCPPQCNNSEPGFCTYDCVSGCGCSSDLYRSGNKCYKKNDCPKSPGMTSTTSVPC